MKNTSSKPLIQIANEWDTLAPIRQEAINAKEDVSLLEVTVPHILQEVQKLGASRVLDVGCGSGYLTSQIRNISKECVGIDASSGSVSSAQKHYQEYGLSFRHSTIHDYVDTRGFDICVSNMVFSCDPEWIESAKHIYTLLRKNGKLLVMLPHPSFWPQYWQIEHEPWFSYEKQLYIEHDFSITKVKSLGKATHIHRPCSAYINGLYEAGFVVEHMEELHGKPTNNSEKDYYHQFLYLRCKKQDTSILE